MRRLYQLKIETDDDNIFRIIPDNNSVTYGAKEFSIKANPIMLKNFLRRCKVSDSLKLPRSYRSISYNEIINLINNKNGNIFIFSNMYPSSHEELESIMRY